jgi:uncharacterized Fe-S center protein
MASKVYFLPGKDKKELLEGMPRLLGRLIDADFSTSPFCGVKVHVGEAGNKTFVPADFSKVAVGFLSQKGARAFLFETNTLYYGRRGNTVDHLLLAAEHGFSAENTGAPLVIADGMRGEGSVEMPVNGELLKRAKLGALIPEIPVVVGLSHFKGHMLSGFGGTIKNFSMGCAAKGGKLQMHSLTKPRIDMEKCIRCGDCQEQCPADAIVTRGEDFVIVHARCTGCAGCIGVCPSKAVRIDWNEASESASKKMAEYALAALKGKQGFYVNFLINITKECDCLGEEMDPMHPDVGILASLDPVAVDQACLDMVEKEIKSAHPEVDPAVQLAHGERIGLGKRDYSLEEL